MTSTHGDQESPRAWLALDCHGWEDFPKRLRGNQAAEVLAGWSACWHPDVLAAGSEIPSWHRIDQIPPQPPAAMIVLPEFLRGRFAADQELQLTESGGHLVPGNVDREVVVERILGAMQRKRRPFSEGQCRDFYSLGYCFLQVQLMTRQLRYVSSLDLAAFRERLLEALAAAENGEPPPLQRCFDLLIEERSRYYPTTASLIDCLYLNPASPLDALRVSLEMPHRFSLHVPGCVVQTLASDGPVASRIRQRLKEGSLSIAVGPYRELADPLLSTATVTEQLARSRGEIERNFPDALATTIARRRAGMTPLLPGAIRLAGGTATIHATLDDEVFPRTSSGNIRWQGSDGETLDALAAPPRLADSPETWLATGVAIGEAIDSSHFATVFFVHWPGVQCVWYDDLVHSTRFGDVLGRFVTLEQYFDQASDPGYTQDYALDGYRFPGLVQLAEAGEPDSVSRFVDYWNCRADLLAGEGLRAILAALGQTFPCDERPDGLSEAVDLLSEGRNESVPPGVTATHDAAIEQVAERLTRASATVDRSAYERGLLLVNPFSFSRSRTLEGGRRVTVPAMGYVWVPPTPGAASPRAARGRRAAPRLVADDHVLRNECLVCELNPRTGGIASIHFHENRRTLVSQQLGIRRSASTASRGQRHGDYPDLVVESLEVVEETATSAAMLATGRFVRGNKSAGEFRQLTRIESGSPVVTLELDVEVHEEIEQGPWDNYLANRLAWQDESATLSTWINECRQPTSIQRITAPLVLEIEQAAGTVCLLTGGAPFHQRIGYRRLDTILAPSRGERRRWRLGIGVAVEYPLPVALEFLHPLAVLPDQTRPVGESDSGWLFHLNCRNVVVLRWQSGGSRDGGAGGSRDDGTNRDDAVESLWLLVRETEGRSAPVTLDCGRTIRSAWKIDLTGNRLEELLVADGRVSWEMSGRQLAHVEISW